MKKGIAFFDFDGTITSKDTLLEFIKYIYGNFHFVVGIVRLLPMILGLKLGLKDRQKSKESLLKYFFENMSEFEFQEKCHSFSKEILPNIIRPEALKKLKWHRSQGHRLVLVSASPENWLKDWCIDQNMDCLSTQLEIKNGVLTGKISGKNCHGEEKVIRIRDKINLNEFNEIYAYGDSEGDLNMLSLANFPFYKKFF
uniref:HAD family hydrolase n=1 Tax=Algoriphagus sp. TaxID=1872435 RepID=UPI0040472A11